MICYAVPIQQILLPFFPLAKRAKGSFKVEQNIPSFTFLCCHILKTVIGY